MQIVLVDLFDKLIYSISLQALATINAKSSDK